MRVKMLTTAAGPDGVWPAGHEIDVPDSTAVALLNGKFATEVRARRETATVTAEEMAVDDLTAINGVGKKTALELNAIDIHTFAELADADAAVLAALLSRSEPQAAEWIEQANERVSG